MSADSEWKWKQISYKETGKQPNSRNLHNPFSNWFDRLEDCNWTGELPFGCCDNENVFRFCRDRHMSLLYFHFVAATTMASWHPSSPLEIPVWFTCVVSLQQFIVLLNVASMLQYCNCCKHIHVWVNVPELEYNIHSTEHCCWNIKNVQLRFGWQFYLNR
jgi:hypothetical protein